MSVSFRTKRIIAAVEADDDDNVLGLADLLSATLNAEILGLYVEDEELMDAAALPFTRAVAFGSGEIRMFEPAELEQAFRAGADRLRRRLGDRRLGDRRLGESRRRARASWSLEVVRGAGGLAALERASESDLLILTRKRRQPPLRLAHGSMRCSIALVPAERKRAAATARSVAVFYTGDARILRFAADLAKALDAELRILVVGKEAGPAASLVRRARAWLRRNAVVAEVSKSSVATARDYLSRQEGGILVSALPGEDETTELESLVNGLESWALVLLRA